MMKWCKLKTEGPGARGPRPTQNASSCGVCIRWRHSIHQLRAETATGLLHRASDLVGCVIADAEARGARHMHVRMHVGHVSCACPCVSKRNIAPGKQNLQCYML